MMTPIPDAAGEAIQSGSLLARLGIWTLRRILWVRDGFITLLTVPFSKEGLVWVASTLLLGGVLCGWLETPLQGVIRGFAFPLSGHVALTDALTNPPRLLSCALPCVLGAALAVWRRIWRCAPWLPRHAGAALLIVVLAFPAGLISRQQVLVEHLVNQDQERDAIREFASMPAVNRYSSSLSAIPLAGNSTLIDRALTVLQLIGYGWEFTLVGASLLLIVGVITAGSRRTMLFVAGWVGVAVLVLGTIAAPALIAEYHRLRGVDFYARGQYDDALAHLLKSLQWAPDLREIEAFQYRMGATLFWSGDYASPPARLFQAKNLQIQGKLEKAELQLVLALTADPHWGLARRKLAELNATRGLEYFQKRKSGAIVRWERGLDIDASLLRIHYFLAQSYYELDGRDQSRAVTQASQMIALTRDRGILADVYALLGDSYFKAYRDTEARAMYQRSIAIVPLVKRLNLQAQAGLLGL